MLFKTGLVDNRTIYGVGASITYDWRRYFVRLAYDPHANFAPEDMWRLSVPQVTPPLALSGDVLAVVGPMGVERKVGWWVHTELRQKLAGPEVDLGGQGMHGRLIDASAGTLECPGCIRVHFYARRRVAPGVEARPSAPLGTDGGSG